MEIGIDIQMEVRQVKYGETFKGMWQVRNSHLILSERYFQCISLPPPIEAYYFEETPYCPVKPQHVFYVRKGPSMTHDLGHPMRLHVEPVGQVCPPNALLNDKV